MSYGGVNAGVVIHEDTVIAIHGKENVDSSVIGRMVCHKKPSKLPGIGEEILLLGKDSEVWRNNSMESFTSTPVYRNGRLYTTIKRVNLFASTHKPGRNLDAQLAPDQVHARLFGRMENCSFRCSTANFRRCRRRGFGRILGKTTLDGACLAAPSAAHGRVFVQTKKRLYCFGSDLPAPAFVAKPQEELKHESSEPSDGLPVVFQVVPSEFALKSGSSQAFKVYALDRTGRRIEEVKEGLAWEKWIPQPPKFNPKSMLKWTIPVSLLPIWGPSFGGRLEFRRTP